MTANTTIGILVWWSLTGRVNTDAINDDLGSWASVPKSTMKSHLAYELQSLGNSKTKDGSSLIVRAGKVYVQLKGKPKSDAIYTCRITEKGIVERNMEPLAHPCVEEAIVMAEETWTAAKDQHDAKSTCYPQLNHWLKSWMRARGVRMIGRSPVWLLPEQFSGEFEQIKEALRLHGQSVYSVSAGKADHDDLADTVAGAIANEMLSIMAEVRELDSLSYKKRDGYMMRLAKLNVKMNNFSSTMQLQAEVVADAQKKVVEEMRKAIDNVTK